MKSKIIVGPINLKISKYPNGDLKLENLNNVINYIKDDSLYTLPVSIIAYIVDSDGLMALALLNDFLRNHDRLSITLNLKHCPYMQMDRIENKHNDTLSIKTFCNMINAMCFDKVYLYGYHSNVTLALLNKCEAFDTVDVMSDSFKFRYLIRQLNEKKSVVIVAPDAGAMKLAHKAQKLFPGSQMITCTKNRDFETGKINGIDIHYGILPKDPVFLIFDDVSVNGGTFSGISKAINEKFFTEHDAEIYLFTTHLINGHKIEGINKAYTTDFYPTNNIDESFVEILNQVGE